MVRVIIFFVFVFIITLVFSQVILKKDNNYKKEYLLADKLFRQSENLLTKKGIDEFQEEKINTKALSLFKKTIPDIEKAGDDSLAFFCHFKIGLLYHYFDSTELAKKEYELAIIAKEKSKAIEDSLLFKPLLFCAIIYHGKNEFDSAYIFYKKAEAISEKYIQLLAEQERLYNGLGAIHYEIGNYRQAKNYFEKALLLLLHEPNTDYKDFFIKYKSNIALCQLKLENYSEADSIYNSILPFNTNTNEILLNLGSISLLRGNATKAISYFKKVYYNNSQNVLLFNKIGMAFLQLGKLDSSEKYLQMALNENEKWRGSKKNKNHGNTFQYLGDKFIFEKDYKNAIVNYQNAFLQFYPDYNETDIYKNPQTFSGIFSYINLFNTLTAKADAFEKLYEQDKNQISLEAALNAYRSAFLLAGYVEKTYDSDEARLFLNKIKYKVHDSPIQISLQLFELTKSMMYLEQAYSFDQQNKASILSLNVQESALKKQANLNTDLFEKESSVKRSITRLSLKASQINDSTQLEKLKIIIRDNEIMLGKIQDNINKLPGYREKKFAQSIPSIEKLQKNLSNKSAILSYHLIEKKLIIFCIKKEEFSYTQQSIDTSFYNYITLFKKSLNNLNVAEKYNGSEFSSNLYKQIIKPIWNKINNINELLIIPDDELNNIPFEALTDEEGNYLLRKFSIQYQYSTALLRDEIKTNIYNTYTFALAPFTDIENTDFPKLTYSKKEVENIGGNILIDAFATKTNFLKNINKNGVLHLATHTVVNDTIPEKSFIAFYPAIGMQTDENNLYLQEIYNLKLDSTKLVILSACETGTGKLSKGEGLMSLSRAFTYAGCPNIISSLWKADDKSTAWIIQRFYHYYNDGINAAPALQKAKFDYIQSPEIEKRFKSPKYWAHLVLTGLPENKSSSFLWVWAGGIISICIITLLFFLKKWAAKLPPTRDKQKEEIFSDFVT
jgi:CHAT domain-containing protein/tetratricopeptide (TPR) repeat protein